MKKIFLLYFFLYHILQHFIIRIWDFHFAKLLRKIYINNDWLYSICLYLFVGCKDIILIKLNESKILKNLKGHTNKVLTLKNFIHPKKTMFNFSRCR